MAKTLSQCFHLNPLDKKVPTDFPVTAIKTESAVQLCSALVTIYSYFDTTELVLIYLALNFFVLWLDGKRPCSDAKQEKRGMRHPHHDSIYKYSKI